MSDLELARQTLDASGHAFVLVRDGTVLAIGTERGVAELLAAIDRLGRSVRGASLADKVVGKAVALIAAATGLVAIDATLASRAAVDFCATHGIPLTAQTVVSAILNRRGDGPCPMERLTTPINDPVEGLARLRAFLAAAAKAG